MNTTFHQTLRRVAQWFGFPVRRQRSMISDADYRVQYLGVAPAVSKIIEVIESNLPAGAMKSENYKSLSPGQKALAEAVVYLNYQHLAQAKQIVSEAKGDPNCPGDQWVSDLMDAIDLADRMPENSIDAGAQRRADKHERRRLTNAAQLRQARDALRDLDN